MTAAQIMAEKNPAEKISDLDTIRLNLSPRKIDICNAFR
jgi:hypothetical protein